MKKFRHFTYFMRVQLEGFLNSGMPVKDIASQLNISPASVYREIKRGQYEHLNTDYTTDIRYSADLAEEKYRINLSAKGPGLKIGNDIDYAAYIESLIVDKKFSPEAALAAASEHGFKTSLSKTTLYRYIEDGLFLNLTTDDLPVKRKKKGIEN